VLGVLGQYLAQVLLVVDEQTVGAFRSCGADEPLGVGVHPGRLRCALEDRDVLRGEDRVEGLGVFVIPVAQQVSEGAGALAEVGQEIPRELRDPDRTGMGSDSEDVHAPGAKLHYEEHIQPLQSDGVDVEEVRGQQP
jgi:hypothetical protein